MISFTFLTNAAFGAATFGYYERSPHSAPAAPAQSEAPCPEAASIAPCRCSVITPGLQMDCSDVTSDEELNAAFLSYFPVTDFYLFKLFDNVAVKQLQANCFSNVTFDTISIYNTSINMISGDALALSGSYNLESISIEGGYLTESTFPFDYLYQWEKLEYLSVTEQSQMTAVPTITSNWLNRLHLSGSAIDSISPGN